MPDTNPELKANRFLKLLVVLISYGLYLLIGYVIQREDFGWLWAAFAGLFAIYILSCSHFPRFRVREYVLVGMLFRLSFFLSFPELSDDFYRFVWDGRATVAGMNPYLSLPQDDIHLIGANDIGFTEGLYEKLNSKEYYTVYPPVAQGIYALSAWMGKGDINSELIVMRLFLLVAELITMVLMVKLLTHFKLPAARVGWYALNPLVIVELSGNLHFEGLMLMFILLAFWSYVKEGWIPSAIAMGLAISTKLIPLMFLPLLIGWKGFRKAMVYGVLACGVFALSFLAFFSDAMVANMSSSIDLYFRTFEFNASVYYLFRQAGELISGYNLVKYIGPGLSVVTLISVLALSFRKREEYNWFFLAGISLTIYLLLSTTVHPWYIVTLVGISVFARLNHAVWWSFLVVLSYSHYAGGGFQENYVLIAAEYILLGVGMFLTWKKPDWSMKLQRSSEF